MENRRFNTGSSATKISDLVEEVFLKNRDDDTEVLSVSEGHGIIYQSELFKKQIATDDKSKYRSVRYGDVVYNPYLLWNAAVGVCFYPEGGCVSPAYKVLRPFHKHTERFLHYLFRSQTFTSTVDAIATGTVTRRRTAPIDQILGLSFKLPSLQYQRRANEILCNIDDKIELNRKINDALERMAQAIYQSWFVNFDPVIDNALTAGNHIPESLIPRADIRRKLRQEKTTLFNLPADCFPSSFTYTEELGHIPNGWSASQLDQVGKITTGKTPPKSVQAAFGCGPMFLTPTDYNGEIVTVTTQRRLSKNGEQSIPNARLKKGSLCVTCIGSQMGKTTLVADTAYTNQQINSLSPFQDSYRYFLLLNLRLRRNEIFSIGASGSTMPIVNKGVFSQLKIVRPDEVILTEFERIVSPLIERIRNNVFEFQKLTKIRDTLLPKLISGELSTKQADQLVKDLP